ncbi:SDR family NAD(P)-dependent oxidoreductase [Thalassotalea aquiviva]|uniref:SDR family NAD(P)-dependent oxidoreductase n=1 Tax=Thalassotalea aquiviva TaxID=3242415 RepID=UPI00352BAFFC
MKKVCLLSGGSSGIGEAIAKVFEQHNYAVYNLDIKPGKFGHYIECDVSKVDEVKTKVAELVAMTGRVDVMISNAGKHLSANIEQTDEQTFDDVFALNVKGAYALTQSVLPTMQSQQTGSIIYVASDQAIIGKRNSFAYNLSKHALASMAKTTALDYANFNIRANALCPGTIETPLYHQAIDNYCQQSGANKAEVDQQEAALQPLNRLGQSEEVAHYALFLASEQASFITGSLQIIDGGYTCQ